MENVDRILSELGEFAYIRSYGNLGDLLIAESTEQYFDRKGYKYTVVSAMKVTVAQEHTLVHGGGGVFTSDWCDIQNCINVLCNKQVKKCVILPSSFYGVDELLKHFDSRHVLFCRDVKSYEYCLSKCPTSEVYLEHDTAIHLQLESLQPSSLDAFAEKGEEQRLKTALKVFLQREMMRGMRRSTVKIDTAEGQQRVAFLLRTDNEKKAKLKSLISYDISLAYHAPAKNKFNANLLLLFSQVLKQADVIVSDRLHVCIMAYLSGLKVYMLDNTYGKLKGVYELSLKDCDRVHLVQDNQLPTEIQEAWKKLNKPLHVLLFKGLRFIRKVINKAKRISKRMLRK